MNVVDGIDEVIDAHLPQSEEAINRRKNRILKPLAVVAVVAALGVGGKVAYETFRSPNFSDQTTTYTFEDGEGPLDAAAAIEGLGDDRDGVAYIQNMPENQEAFSDGIQRGETITIPISADK